LVVINPAQFIITAFRVFLIFFNGLFIVVLLSVLFARNYAHKANAPMPEPSKFKLIAVYILLANIAYFLLKGVPQAAIPELFISLVIYAAIIYILLSFGSRLGVKKADESTSQ